MKNTIQNIKENYKLVIGVLIFGLFLGWIFFHSSGEVTNSTTEINGHEGHSEKTAEPTVWTCSMHPQIKQDKPGLCPICAMDLIPLTSMGSGGDDVDPNEIVMSESAAKLASIETMLVTRGIPEKTVYLQGKVQADERNIVELTARFGGRIEKLFVNFTGQNVKKGEKLATIYSPGLVTAQRELLEAISFKESRPSLYIAAKGKLKLWDLTDEQIVAIEEKGEPQVYFDVQSPISGTVYKRHVSIGDYVKEGTPLFEVIDLSKVWVMFDAYESDLPWIKQGDQVNVTVQALPGQNFSAKVSFIDPFLNGTTRVAKVRVELANRKQDLKPEMFAIGIVESKIAESSDQILIPKSAILWTGKRAVVYVKVPDRDTPSFLYREIVLGPEAGAFYMISEGLNEGEEIAVNGVFKIDAASQLQGLPSMMNPSADGGKISTGHDHGGTAMSDQEMENMDEKNSSTIDISAEIPIEFEMQLNKVLQQYLLLKDAFVATDAQQAGIAAQNTLDVLDKVDMSLLSSEAHKQWMKLQKPISDNLTGIIQMQGIEMKRSHFSIVSNNLTKAIEMFGNPGKKTLYYQYCPMAFDDKGAYWLSDEEQIRNPYFGDVMLKCGEVKKEFEQ